MPQSQTLRVTGYREFLRAASRAEKESRKEVRAAFREAGDIVTEEAASRFEDISPKTAQGFRTRVRQRGVSSEQALRRTTGKRPDFGALQMRKALIPALEEKEDEVAEAFGDALDRVADHFER